MLLDLRVRDLGVIVDLELSFGRGMTALTGETGAGKTLVVSAIELLRGAKADASLVRTGATEAIVEGRFLDGDDEVVLRRVVPVSGRSKTTINGEMTALADFAERAASLVDLHGQHAHQSLLSVAAQRGALDRFAGVDLTQWRAARTERVAAQHALEELGGDERARAREADLVRFQVSELDAAQLSDPDEDDALAAEEDLLAEVTAHREAGQSAYAALSDDDAGLDAFRAALSSLARRTPFSDLHDRLASVLADAEDLSSELGRVIETIAEDPERLAAIRARRQLLVELRRKYGATLADVMSFHAEAEARLAILDGHDAAVQQADRRLADALAAETAAAKAVATARQSAAPRVGDAVGEHLEALALKNASLTVAAEGEPPADDVTFLFSANKGEAPLPLAKVASGGELARVMLALRLVLSDGPPTMVFDEVDAGVGGEAAIAVGRSLASLGRDGQVFVVTHLPQVAAFADSHVLISKSELDARTEASATVLDSAGRVRELSRMLAGRQESAAAQKHAKELLAEAKKERAS